MRLLRFVPAHYQRFEKCLYHSGTKGVYGHQPALPKRFAESPLSEEEYKNRASNANFYRLVTAFREHGHRKAQINPLSTGNTETVSEIDVDRYALSKTEKVRTTGILNVPNQHEISIDQGLGILERVYTSQIGYEFMYIEDEAEREWFAKRAEELSLTKDLISNEYKVQLALEMAKSQNFDHFLANKFATVKRYGGEGCETLMAFFLELLNSCAQHDVDNVVLGMAHRGRLNLLAGPLNYSPVRMFRKMKGFPEFPPDARASGDVLSHLSTSVDLDVQGKRVHCILLPNSSHLEAVNPMAVGKVRGKQKTLKDYDYSEAETVPNSSSRVLCVQIHGDAAISGQGVNQETLGFANVPHFRVGGSIHLITNNQLGFTTPQERGRSSRYSSDVAKMIGAPVIHVNGDCPHEVVQATKLAVEYRQKFHKDVFVDLICFRRWGHNELDDPTFTNPQIYSVIHSRKSIPDNYNEKLIQEGVLDPALLKTTLDEQNHGLGENMKMMESHVPPKTYLQAQWSNIAQAQEQITTWDTGVDTQLLKYVGAKSVELPPSFKIHPHLEKTYVKARVTKVTNGTNIDWATAETLAVGSLIYQGFDVRFSGEDVGRGTFSHRHMMLVDQETGEIIIPLNSLVEKQEHNLEMANTTLSEEAVLAFEYGFSLDHPSNLCIWEAQFGDFFNGAQIIIDTMITSGETKWMHHSGIVMLLPHGMDGAGPEHSSCRLERFLQMTDSNEADKIDGDYNNFQVVNPTTPAQYFHLLRRQMIRNFRKPMVVVAPKTLIRLSSAQSTLDDMAPGTHFKPVLGDPSVNPKDVKKLIFVSGKHFYTLQDKRQELKRNDIAIIRIESLCPFPAQEIKNELDKYKNVKDIIWSQEEHRNMGAWTFIKPRFQNLVGTDIKYVGRGPLGAPAVGIGQIYHQEVAKIIKDTFA